LKLKFQNAININNFFGKKVVSQNGNNVAEVCHPSKINGVNCDLQSEFHFEKVGADFRTGPK